MKIDKIKEKLAIVVTSIGRKGLGRTLLFWFLGLSIIPLILVSLINFWNTYNQSYEREKQALEAVAYNKQAHIGSYFTRIATDLRAESSKQANVRFLLALENGFRESGQTVQNFVKSYQWALIEDEYSTDIKVFQRTYGYDDLFLIDTDGNVLFSVLQESALGSNLFTGEFSDTKFSASCQIALETGEPVLSDFEFFDPSHHVVTGFFISVMVDEFGDKVGLIALQIPYYQMNEILVERSGMGETGESYLVGDDFLMRSESRFGENMMLMQKVETEAVISAMRGDTGTMIIKDYRGVEVLSSFFPLDFPGGFITNFNWVMITEIDRSQVFASLSSMQLFSGLLLLITAILVVFLAMIIADRIVKPIRYISGIATQAANGEIMKINEGLNRNDEIGVLLKSFDKLNRSNFEMVQVAERISKGDLSVKVTPRSDKDALGKALALMSENLKEQIVEIGEGVNVLAASTTEIITSISQLASTATETASSISETATTVEEVKQGAEVTSQKAKEVSEKATKMSRISVEGTNATANSVSGMEKITEQMNMINEMVEQLEEQSQTIGDITFSVNNLAEQSNLLALNAAIEAAKAEEHGIGFTVVAEEIRTLSDQSKQATSQVRKILQEIRESINSVMVTTVDGGKLVEDGMKLTTLSGNSIKSLSESVTEAANTAVQIAASSQQQLEGIDQVVTAMENIRESSVQSATSTQQTADSVKELQGLGTKLEELMKQYKLEAGN